VNDARSPVADAALRRWLTEHRSALEPELVGDYRELHGIPELAFEERLTARYLAARLEALGLEPQVGIEGTGVIVEVPGGTSGPTVMLRADMDGLPIEEDPSHDPGSRHPGRMHACGHDGHMAIVLAAARAFATGAPPLPGRLLLLFQPAEEAGGGARRIVEAGWLDRLGVDFILGLHLWSFAPLGRAIIPDGTVLASSDEFQVGFHGPGGHGALPHESQDVVLAAAHLVVAMQSIVARDVDPVRPAVLTVGRLEAGKAPNVIPRRAEVQGTFRAGDGETRARVLHRIGEVAEAIARVHGVRAEVDFGTGYPATINDAGVAAVYRTAAAEVLGASAVAAGPPAMASEDFAFYLQHRRGAFCLLGMADEATGSAHPHHSPAFRIAEAALFPGLETMLLAAWSLMNEPPD